MIAPKPAPKRPARPAARQPHPLTLWQLVALLAALGAGFLVYRWATEPLPEIRAARELQGLDPDTGRRIK